MNRSIAISLIVGSIFAIITGVLTKQTKYYDISDGTKKEVLQSEYPNNQQTSYNSTLILVSLIGGIGVGYLCSDIIEKRMKNLSK
ncbi:hypothetical protein OK344_05175 [Kaistella sp. BT6-1-3]|uniref:DUF4235 domain-containing protein n=1 Tax=Kaistella yananensis TaxID=2989820 RepID=A0ABT3JMC2_9FLAO|nr:hypothetical protein [Kaistella yananensis]MCW4451595.1 hypothetical protein [Kaistella yananensis]